MRLKPFLLAAAFAAGLFTGAVRAEGWAQAGLPSESAAGPGQSYDELRAKAAGKQ